MKSQGCLSIMVHSVWVIRTTVKNRLVVVLSLATILTSFWFLKFKKKKLLVLKNLEFYSRLCSKTGKFRIFWKNLEIFWKNRKNSEIFRNFRKKSEKFGYFHEKSGLFALRQVLFWNVVLKNFHVTSPWFLLFPKF